MSLLTIAPDIASAASTRLEDLGTDLRKAASAAARPTTAVLAPAVDEVSEAITALFGTHAQEFQAVSAKAAAFHDQFVASLNNGVATYIHAEAENAHQILASIGNTPLQNLLELPSVANVNALAAEAENDMHYILNIDSGSDGPPPPIQPFVTARINLVNLATQEGTGFLSGGFRLNTPFGSTPLFAETGYWTTYADASRWVTYLQQTPGGSTGFSAYFPPGSVYSSSFPQALTLHMSGLNVSWPGNYGGGLLPNAGINFNWNSLGNAGSYLKDGLFNALSVTNSYAENFIPGYRAGIGGPLLNAYSTYNDLQDFGQHWNGYLNGNFKDAAHIALDTPAILFNGAATALQAAPVPAPLKVLGGIYGVIGGGFSALSGLLPK